MASLNIANRKLANDETDLARLFGQAFHDGGVSFEEVTLADGRHMTRVHAGGSTYCAVMDSNNTSARDVFRDGVHTKITTCP